MLAGIIWTWYVLRLSTCYIHNVSVIFRADITSLGVWQRTYRHHILSYREKRRYQCNWQWGTNTSSLRMRMWSYRCSASFVREKSWFENKRLAGWDCSAGVRWWGGAKTRVLLGVLERKRRKFIKLAADSICRSWCTFNDLSATTDRNNITKSFETNVPAPCRLSTHLNMYCFQHSNQ